MRGVAFHFKVALILGILFRIATAYFAYGPSSMDDYIDGVSPALQWADGGSPKLSAGRSYLLVWTLGSILKVAKFDHVVDRVRFLYGVLGIFSLSIMLWMAWKYYRSAILAYLLALYCFLPFASTRAFGEAVAMPWVFAGVVVPNPFLSGIFLGVASLYRFQCGLIYLFFFWVWRKDFLKFAAAGLVALGLQLLVDYGSGYAPLQTLTDYWARNKGWAAEYGVQPWYTHWATLLAVTFFPFCLWLRPKFREYRVATAAILVFVFFHSLIPHKEERFLLPIVPLVLLLMASGWTKKFQWAFVPLNALVLFLVSFSNPQASMVEPVVEVQKRYDGGIILETDNDLVGSYLGQGIFLKKPFVLMREQELKREFFENLHADGSMAILVTGFDLPTWIREKCLKCREAGSLTDRLLYRLNPKHNSRRRPNTYCFCAG